MTFASRETEEASRQPIDLSGWFLQATGELHAPSRELVCLQILFGFLKLCVDDAHSSRFTLSLRDRLLIK
jgi:hypothetical protein